MIDLDTEILQAVATIDHGITSARLVAEHLGRPLTEIASDMRRLESERYLMSLPSRLGSNTGQLYQLTTRGRLALQSDA